MMPDREYGEPEESTVVDEPQVPMPRQWSFDTNTMMMVALGVLGVGFAVWFLVQYTQAKAKAVVEAASNES